MDIVRLDRESVVKQSAQNLIEAQVAKPEEYQMLTEALRKLDPKNLLTVLLESHKFREEAPERISFYPIDVDAISMN